MTKKLNSVPMRIDFELAKRIRTLADQEGLSDSQASRRVAKLLDTAERTSKKLSPKIRF